jgi:hypothetical protein
MRSTFYLLLGSSLLWLGCDQAAAPQSQPAAPPVSANAPARAVSAAPIAAAPAAPAPAATPPVAAPGHFGAPLSGAAALPAQAVLTDAAKYDDKDVKLTGQVSAACQRKGCWMTLGGGEPGEKRVRISFKDYGFFVPTDCTGKTAIVEGHFKVSTMSVAAAQHYADDAAKAGAPVKKVTAPQQEYSLVATGVELL